MERVKRASVFQGEAEAQQHIKGPVVKKNSIFYRRTGPLWTDLYHTPSERLHLTNFRPDLDQQHALYVQQQVERQQRAMEQEKLRLMERQSRVRAAFQKQFRENRQKKQRRQCSETDHGHESFARSPRARRNGGTREAETQATSAAAKKPSQLKRVQRQQQPQQQDKGRGKRQDVW